MKSLMLEYFILFTIIKLAYTGEESNIEGTKLDFPNYKIIKTPNFESKFKSSLNKCEFKTDCSKLNLHVKQNCIFKCVSSKCYEEIYSFDPLEEGELDQRFNSFRGCVSTEL